MDDAPRARGSTSNKLLLEDYNMAVGTRTRARVHCGKPVDEKSPTGDNRPCDTTGAGERHRGQPVPGGGTVNNVNSSRPDGNRETTVNNVNSDRPLGNRGGTVDNVNSSRPHRCLQCQHPKARRQQQGSRTTRPAKTEASLRYRPSETHHSGAIPYHWPTAFQIGAVTALDKHSNP